MVLTYREAANPDANLLIDIYNSSFYQEVTYSKETGADGGPLHGKKHKLQTNQCMHCNLHVLFVGKVRRILSN